MSNASASAEKTAGADVMYVLDTTARPSNYAPDGREISGARVHEQFIGGQIKPYRFEYGKPLELPRAIAVKFLREPAFQLTDSQGNQIPYDPTPTQPDQAQAGQKFRIDPDKTVARYDELTTESLLRRALELPSGEKFGTGKPSRKALIEFIIETRTEAQIADMAKPEDEDNFVPEPDGSMDDIDEIFGE